MKNAFSLVAATGLAISGASAHYIFEQFSLGSTQYPVYQYSTFVSLGRKETVIHAENIADMPFCLTVRENTNYNSPVTGSFSDTLSFLQAF